MSKTGRCSGHAVILGRLTGSMLALGLPESHIDDDLGGPVRVYGQFGSSRQLPNLVICKTLSPDAGLLTNPLVYPDSTRTRHMYVRPWLHLNKNPFVMFVLVAPQR
jgi:hypothetical protein